MSLSLSEVKKKMAGRKQYAGPKDFDFFFFLIIKTLHVLIKICDRLLKHESKHGENLIVTLCTKQRASGKQNTKI